MKKRRQKKLLFLTVLFMAVGFAAVTTTLVFNGTLNLLGDTESFVGDVIFTKAKTEAGGLASIIKEGKEITFTSKELSKVNESTTLNFDITNKNRQYDAVASINCNTSVSDYAEYITIIPNKTEYEISAGGTVSGHLTATLIKSYDQEEGTDIAFTCTLNVEARERDTLGDEYVPVEPFSKAGTLMKVYTNEGIPQAGKFWNYYRLIEKVVFEDTMNSHETKEDLIFDVSDKQDGSVMSYLVINGSKDKDNRDLYDLYIQSETGVKANPISSELFTNFSSLKTVEGLEYFDTSEVTTMYAMFAWCPNLVSLDVSSFNTSKVTNMYYMFEDCKSLTNLDVNNWDVSNVTNMSIMFGGCSSLTKLDLNNWNISKVTSMFHMFSGCENLTNLDIDNWNTSQVFDMSCMFLGCNKLTTTITIRGTACITYSSMFRDAATEEGAQITVNYTEDASELVDKMIETKTDNSNIVKGNVVTI